jgi:hypothetical protein
MSLTKPCIICGATITKSPSESLRNWTERRKYCSRKCFGIAKVTVHKTLKLCEACGQPIIPKHRFTQAAWDKKRFCSIQCRIDADAMGMHRENHPAWKGGVTEASHALRSRTEYITWRQQVYERDHWTCRQCGKKEKKIVAHHIKNFRDYPELRYVIENGITCCRPCHKIIHSEIGLGTRFQPQEVTV